MKGNMSPVRNSINDAELGSVLKVHFSRNGKDGIRDDMSSVRICSSLVQFITEAASSNTLFMESSDFDKLAASWKAEYKVPLIANKSSYETTPFFSRNDSNPGNRCDIFL
ncbi:hypothetical protein TNCV_3664321 [Trichonephila clavipes]|nr:hypothetical protein TNCV_3664321 [Trichonephila clavipes]